MTRQLGSKMAEAFKGIQVPVGKTIKQSSNPTLNGYGYKLKSMLMKTAKQPHLRFGA